MNSITKILYCLIFIYHRNQLFFALWRILPQFGVLRDVLSCSKLIIQKLQTLRDYDVPDTKNKHQTILLGNIPKTFISITFRTYNII